jgi:glycosyltransferase involved in cell wall biosynthesis
MWADEAVFRPSSEDMRPELKIPSNAVVLLYAGAMGDAQGLESLIDACALVDDPRFVCVLAGSGITESRLRQHAVSVDNVRFVGRVPQSSMTRLMATGDLNYVGLRPHALSPITMPSKTQAALAAGRPLLVAAKGDVAHVVDEAGIGFVADPASSQSIAEAIKQALALGRDGLAVLGQKARATYDESFSAAEGVSRIERLLQIAADSRKDRE